MKSVFIAMLLLMLVGCSSDSGSNNSAGSTPAQPEEAAPEEATPKNHPMKAGESYVSGATVVTCNTSGAKMVVGTVVGLVPDTEHTLNNTTYTCTL